MYREMTKSYCRRSPVRQMMYIYIGKEIYGILKQVQIFNLQFKFFKLVCSATIKLKSSYSILHNEDNSPTTHFISFLTNGNAIHTPRVASTCMDTLHWILLPVPLPDQYGLVMWSRDESASWSTILNEEINQLPKSMSTIPISNYAQFTVCYKFVTSN